MVCLFQMSRNYSFFLSAVLTCYFLTGKQHFAYCQNLVKNPSFEIYSQCPQDAGFFNGYLDDWFAFTGNNTSSYFNECGQLTDGIPENIFGY